jgi:hemerythrin
MSELVKTGDEAIDAIHYEESLLVEDFIKVLKDGSDEEIIEIFEKLIDHMQMHFSFEEELMDKHSGYTMANVHKNEHYKVLSDARYKMQNFRNFKDKWDLEDYLDSDFLVWLDQHIKAMDIPMVDYFKGVK